ncbi:MAG: GNAT family N-acetyltransferase [Christensenellales bacterium]
MAKNNKLVTLNLNENDFYEIEAFDDKNNQIGFCNFSIKNHSCWLYKICVTEQEYLGQGVGKKMLKMLEKVAKENNCYSIEGKFYPEGNGAERAKMFYEKNGYSIQREDYQQYIFKNIFLQKDFEL